MMSFARRSCAKPGGPTRCIQGRRPCAIERFGNCASARQGGFDDEVQHAAAGPIPIACWCRRPTRASASGGSARSACGMKLAFDDQALADLEHIFKWIARQSRRRQEGRGQAFQQHGIADVVSIHGPRRPRLRHVRMVVPRLPYIVVYEVDSARGEVIVTAVFHGAQNRGGED